MHDTATSISAIDLFCGAGGLSQGLQDAGIRVVGGVDIEASCGYAFESNIDAPFMEMDVRDVTAAHLEPLWQSGTVRMLAGCAPCQPFSPYRRGVDTSAEEQWPLLREFARLVEEIEPELVTMENVPRIGSSQVFKDFVTELESLGYFVDWKSCYGPRYGLPQHRRRLVLLASRLGPIKVPDGPLDESDFRTVRDVIGGLPPIASGEAHAEDSLHVARRLSPLNLQRIAASKPGGTWKDWPEELLSPCHRKASGASFKNVYARMEWDKPSPTITTLSNNFGAGRFGHPEQARPLSLREAALLQGFPRGYRFVRSGAKINMAPIARLIGNAVPPPIAAEVGRAALAHVSNMEATTN
ncbi:DNA cytosine methyltransferase [Rathayibacter sp. AY1C5]|uniref:DNA cytosine methyltransferase n=1 Tax=Rathayibacter sp. AY1C5 TaxID=2080538 RepID=UPI000CE86A92|nr:DNA cytosine methyltransferase [Rathayibacter sp. AY1C5]PPG61079.1 DNA (cytosine-5-)-methyltransferase [Rathayibacter sp. AY1C5]